MKNLNIFKFFIIILAIHNFIFCSIAQRTATPKKAMLETTKAELLPGNPKFTCNAQTYRDFNSSGGRETRTIYSFSIKNKTSTPIVVDLPFDIDALNIVSVYKKPIESDAPNYALEQSELKKREGLFKDLVKKINDGTKLGNNYYSIIRHTEMPNAFKINLDIFNKQNVRYQIPPNSTLKFQLKIKPKLSIPLVLYYNEELYWGESKIYNKSQENEPLGRAIFEMMLYANDRNLYKQKSYILKSNPNSSINNLTTFYLTWDGTKLRPEAGPLTLRGRPYTDACYDKRNNIQEKQIEEIKQINK